MSGEMCMYMATETTVTTITLLVALCNSYASLEPTAAKVIPTQNSLSELKTTSPAKVIKLAGYHDQITNITDGVIVHSNGEQSFSARSLTAAQLERGIVCSSICNKFGGVCSPGGECICNRGYIGSECMECEVGYYIGGQTSGIQTQCLACACVISKTYDSICDQDTGVCACNNLVKMCSKLSMFGTEISSDVLFWILMLFGFTGVSLVVNWYIQSHKGPANMEIEGFDQQKLMAQLQMQLANLQLKTSYSGGGYESTSRRFSFTEPARRRGSDEYLSHQKINRTKERFSSKTGIGHRHQSKLSAIMGERQQKPSSMSTRTDLDEVTTAVLAAANDKILAARHSYELAKFGDTSSTNRSPVKGVEGDYYIDRVTGKKIKDVSMDADDEGDIVSVIFPTVDGKQIAASAYEDWRIGEDGSLHFSERSEYVPPTSVFSKSSQHKKKRRHKRPAGIIN